MKQGTLTLEDEAFLVNLAMRMRGMLVLCAPRFAEGSEGAATVALARDSFVRLRSLAEVISEASKSEDSNKSGNDDD